MGKAILLKEIVIENWEGKTLRDLDLTNQYGLQVIAIKHKGGKEYTFVPRADQKLKKGDVLAIVGKEENFEKLKP